jgi:flavin reductase (DIM6/NTAB) family NADH-FMN oxidoreductase RutF
MDATAFRRIMGTFATGITVVTTANGDLLHGLTANSVTGLSIDPLLLLVCVDRKAHAHAELERCTSFGVSILAAGQEDVSNTFAKSAPPERGSLRGVPYVVGQTGCPLIEGALAHFECRPHGSLAGGDHTIFVAYGGGGAVARHDAAPLLYYRGSYRGLA